MNYLNQIFKQIPNSIFWKDKNSVFLGANNRFVEISGFHCITEIKGKTDYNMPWGETHADLYRTRDQEAMDDKNVVNHIETQLRSHEVLVTVIVNKTPFLNRQGKIIGIVGSFIELPNGFDTFQNHISLPASQQAVLIHIVQGLSAKEISRKLNLSQRTIEFYTDILKKKFFCRSKSELITKVWQLGLMPQTIR